MKFYIETFGCKVNTYESNYIKESLISNGFLLSDNMQDSDIILINTCTVTNMADAKSKKFVRRVRRENPNCILIVMGCSVQNNFADFQNMNIDILIGNVNKSKVVEMLKDYINNHKKYEYYCSNRVLSFEDMEIRTFDHSRAFIKIQDGCDNFCAYCIIPFMRGACRSKDFNLIIEEANELVKNGHKEIVLTGIHTGSYGNNNHDLVDVINELTKIEGLDRIRLSSVEITELNDKFMDMLKNNSKFCDHLHIPLQAGSNHILKLMNRKYDLDFFENKIKQIRTIRPNISITTDIIVGFPEESSEDFLETYEFSKKIKFSKIHVFPYSKRNGTVASRMKEVQSKEKTNRVHKLLELSNELEKEYSLMFLDKKVSVLIEEVKDGHSIGTTSNYLKVCIPKELKRNEIYEVIYNSNSIK